MKAVIAAGGKGTRLAQMTGDALPKPMVRIAGKPILQHQIERLRENNITEIYLLVGYLQKPIRDYFKNGKKFGVNINYISEDEPLGTAGALYYFKKVLSPGEDFLFLLGDIIFDIDFNRLISFHEVCGGKITLLVHPNSHPYDSDLVVAREDCKVSGFIGKKSERPKTYHNLVNAGIYILNREVINISKPVFTDLERDIIKNEISLGNVYAYRTSEYVKDVGTPERLLSTEKDIIKGTVAWKNLKNPQKAVFIDRDGTVNKENGLIYKSEQFELYDFAAKAVQLVNKSEYLVFIITNQPSVARGLCSEKDIVNINSKMEVELGDKGAYFDDICFCPHHPDKGYPEENKAYKVICNCRKPKIGMLDKLKTKYNLDYSNSWFIGDTTTDIMTGVNAGCKTVLVKTGEAGADKKFNVKADFTAENLLDAIIAILED